MRAIVSTVSTGYFPTALSPESMTASVPSRIALATSEASALVGRGFSIMLSSIWVAVITTLPAALAIAMIRFWTIGTSSVPISTPRSPRATITPSVAARMASRFSIACGLLDLGDDRGRLAHRADEGLRLQDVLGPAHEGHRHVVHLVLDPERRGRAGPSR